MVFDESYRRVLNRLGYDAYQHGFIVRHMNQGTGWNDHLEKCREFILKSLEMIKPSVVTVLGSGWLLELPLSEMLEKVEKIFLVDIVHPPGVKLQVKDLNKVELVTADVSGGLIDEIMRSTAMLPLFRKLKSFERIAVPEYDPGFDPGMVISLNILTQIETLPLKYLEKKSVVSEEEKERLKMEIQNKHISFLRKHKSVLITDVAEVFTHKSGDISEKRTVITDLPQGNYREDWTWNFDLKRSDYYEKRSVLKVAAIII